MSEKISGYISILKYLYIHVNQSFTRQIANLPAELVERTSITAFILL